jgi:CRP-like cAMP-binding protein
MTTAETNGQPWQECPTCPVRVRCVYHHLNSEQREELEVNKKYLERKKGTLLYNEGFPASEFIMLIEGIVKKTTEVKNVGEFIFNFNKGGDFIGLSAAGINTVYTNSIVAFNDVKFCMFSDHIIVRFMRENIAVFNYVMGRFSENTAAIRKRMIGLVYGNAKKRIAETLLELRQQNTANENRIDVSREDLATLIGITRETVARTLSKFNTDKIISFDKKCIVIEQAEKLKIVASTY